MLYGVDLVRVWFEVDGTCGEVALIELVIWWVVDTFFLYFVWVCRRV